MTSIRGIPHDEVYDGELVKATLGDHLIAGLSADIQQVCCGKLCLDCPIAWMKLLERLSSRFYEIEAKVRDRPSYGLRKTPEAESDLRMALLAAAIDICERSIGSQNPDSKALDLARILRRDLQALFFYAYIQETSLPRTVVGIPHPDAGV